MDDLVRLLDWLDEESTPDPALAVATVVNTRGSAYRRPGARMLIRKSFKVQGAVSAGCLERDIIAHCDGMQKDDKPLLLTYDGNSSDELVFGLKLGCDGIVEVLVEPLGQSKRGADFYQLRKLLPQLLSEHNRIAAVTVFDMQSSKAGTAEAVDMIAGEIPATCAAGLVMLETGSQTYELASLPRGVRASLRSESQQLLRNKRSARSFVLQQEIDGFKISALIELVQPITSLLLFGSGQDVAPLAEMADVLGWRVSIVKDHDLSKLPALIASAYISAAVVMTHDYERDGKILHSLFSQKLDLNYIGVVGPRRRAEKLLAELALSGLSLSESDLQCFYSPVGLDIGAERPEEIALSILAEIRAVLSGHSGGLLRSKQGPIHEPTVMKVASLVLDGSVTSLPDKSADDDRSVAVSKHVLNASCRLDHD